MPRHSAVLLLAAAVFPACLLASSLEASEKVDVAKHVPEGESLATGVMLMVMLTTQAPPLGD